MIEKMLYKRWYRKYLKGERRIEIYLEPDMLADCIEKGHIRKIDFRSGNTYACRFLRKELNTKSDTLTGIYEITYDIQKLTFEQFCSFNINWIKKG